MDAKSLIHLLPPYLHGPEGPYLLPAEEALYEATLYRRVAKLEAAAERVGQSGDGTTQTVEASNRVRALFLGWLLTSPRFRRLFPPEGIRLSGASIVETDAEGRATDRLGTLYLPTARLYYSLSLERCELVAIEAPQAHLKSLTLQDCRLTEGINLTGAKVESDLRLDESTFRYLDLREAQVYGTLSLTEAHVGEVGEEKRRIKWFSNPEEEEEEKRRIECLLNPEEEDEYYKEVEVEIAIDLREAWIEGSVCMDNLHLHEALLHANRLKVEGNLSLKRAKVILHAYPKEDEESLGIRLSSFVSSSPSRLPVRNGKVIDRNGMTPLLDFAQVEVLGDVDLSGLSLEIGPDRKGEAYLGEYDRANATFLSLRWADIKGRLTLKNWDEKIGKRMRRLITLENAHIKTLDDEPSIWTHEGKYSLVGLSVVEFSSTAPNSPTERQQWLRGQYAHKPLLKLPGLMIGGVSLIFIFIQFVLIPFLVIFTAGTIFQSEWREVFKFIYEYSTISDREIPAELFVANFMVPSLILFFSLIAVVRSFMKRFSEKRLYSIYAQSFVPTIGYITFSYTLGIISSLNFIIINHLLYQYLHNSQVSFLLAVCAPYIQLSCFYFIIFHIFSHSSYDKRMQTYYYVACSYAFPLFFLVVTIPSGLLGLSYAVYYAILTKAVSFRFLVALALVVGVGYLVVILTIRTPIKLIRKEIKEVIEIIRKDKAGLMLPKIVRLDPRMFFVAVLLVLPILVSQLLLLHYLRWEYRVDKIYQNTRAYVDYNNPDLFYGIVYTRDDEKKMEKMSDEEKAKFIRSEHLASFAAKYGPFVLAPDYLRERYFAEARRDTLTEFIAILVIPAIYIMAGLYLVNYLLRRYHHERRWASQFSYYSPQAYESVADYYLRRGNPVGHTHMQIAKQDDYILYGPVRFLEDIWRILLRYTTGYGYRLWLAGLIAAIIVIVGGEVYKYAYESGSIAPASVDVLVNEPYTQKGIPPRDYPRFQPMVYSLDIFLPIIDLKMESYYLPVRDTPLGSVARGYMLLQIISGWLLTTLFATAVGSLLREQRQS